MSTVSDKCKICGVDSGFNGQLCTECNKRIEDIKQSIEVSKARVKRANVICLIKNNECCQGRRYQRIRNGMFVLNCDICGELADEDFYEFREASNYKRWNGWKSQKRNGVWEDVCPDCAKS